MRIGIDLGGTKIEGILLSATGAELARQRVPTPRAYDATVAAIAELVAVLDAVALAHGGEGAAARPTVGVGIPGALSPATGLVKNANSTWLNGSALDADLAARIGRPVRLANDANCFALSEATDGGGAGARVVFGVILGTGVGGGIVVDGRVLDGATRVAGEWGHNSLPWPTAGELDGARCLCGREGCIEAYLSGPGLARDHHAATGRRCTTHDIVRLAAEGDAEGVATMARYHDRLARSLASVVNLLDPDVIVLGGGMSNVPGIREAAVALLPRWVFSDVVATRVVRHVHGDSSGVRGAAWLWPG